SFLAMMIALIAIVCAVFSVLATLRLRREETSGTGELALATAVSRTHWAFTHVLIALLGGTMLLVVSGAGVGLSAAAVTGENSLIAQSLAASLAYAPALWVTAGLAVAVFGVVPRATGLAWALVVYAFLVVYIGGLLRLPQWALDLSPYTHIPTLPVDDF
ncbi:MAG TPA: ABC transporter permease, partial [Micromonosporaceae bacterium]|nr:ABC transporter permease [Micromonosporaceae bacterium]